MDGKGRATDNIAIERFWRSLKYEHIYLYSYEDNLELYRGISRYIYFYNQKRKHQGLKEQTPAYVYQTDQPIKWTITAFTTENFYTARQALGLASLKIFHGKS